MSKDEFKANIIIPKLKSDEELVGFFVAQYMPSWWWYLVAGPFVAFAMRSYYVAVTDLGLHLHCLNPFGRPAGHEFFTYSELADLRLGKGTLQLPVHLAFPNGRKLKLNAAIRGLNHIAKLTQPTREFLMAKAGVVTPC